MRLFVLMRINICMNKIIKEQLEKVTSTVLDIKENVHHYVIPKTTKFINSVLKEDQCYLIELDDWLLNENSNSTLASNWNGGRYPTHKTYKAEVITKLGNMTKFNGIAVDGDKELLTESFFGWLPNDSFKVIKKVK